MKAYSINVVLLACITSVMLDCLNVAEASPAYKTLLWQPAALENDQIRVILRLQAGRYDQFDTDYHDTSEQHLSVELISEPGQPVHVCAGRVTSTESETLAGITTTESGYTHTLWPDSPRTHLKVIEPHSCHTPSVGHRQVFYSDAPFMVVETHSQRNSGTQKTEIDDDFVYFFDRQVADGSSHLNSYGISEEELDSLPPKPQKRGFFASGSDISLPLLPLARLDWDQILPLNDWRQWLFDSRDDAAGIDLSLRIDGIPAHHLQLSREEFRQLVQQSADIQHWLRWLAPKLSGREAWIQQLISPAENTANLSDPVLQAMEFQLATLLEWPDSEFTDIQLDFEIHQPEQNPVKENGENHNQPTRWILETPNGSPASGRQSGQTGTADSEDSSSESEHTNNDGGELSGSSSKNEHDYMLLESAVQADTIDGETEKNLTITFIGQVNVGKSSLVNCLLGFEHFRHIDQSDRGGADVFDELEGIKIRNVPEYSDDLIIHGNFIANHPIDHSEIVVFVLADDPAWSDGAVLKALLEKGHPVNRILFVRNKFDELLHGSRLNDDFWRDNQQQRLSQFLTENNLMPDGDQANRMIFSSARDIAKFSDEDDHALVSAIESTLSEGEKMVFNENFLKFRPRNISRLSDFTESFFSKTAKNSSLNSSEVFAELIQSLAREFDLSAILLSDFVELTTGRSGSEFDVSSHFVDKLQERFNLVFSNTEIPDHNYFSSQLELLRNSSGSMSKKERDRLKKQFTRFFTTHVIGRSCYRWIREHALEESDALGQTSVHQRARLGQSGRVMMWLELSKNRQEIVKQQDINGRTPLHLAVYSGSQPTVDVLLGYGANPNTRDNVGYTPLHWAAYYGRKAIAERLLQGNAVPTVKNRFRITPLHIAAWCNQADVVEKLLKWGADVKASAYGELPVHYAASAGSLQSLIALLSHSDVLVNALDDRGYTALHHAAWMGHQSVVDKLIARGANKRLMTYDVNPDEDMEYAFRFLLDGDYYSKVPHNKFFPIEIASPLAEEGPSEIDRHGFAYLHRAVREGDKNKVIELFGKGADFAAKSDLFCHTPLHIAAYYGHSEIVELLMELNVTDMESGNLYGDTALHLAALSGHMQIVRDLVNRSVDQKRSNAQGLTALDYAAAIGSEEMVRLLLGDQGQVAELQADLSSQSLLKDLYWEVKEVLPNLPENFERYRKPLGWDTHRLSILHLAAMHGNKPVVIFLHRTVGMELKLTTSNGLTPLHLAALYGEPAVVDLLIGESVDPAPKENNGVTPLFLAAYANRSRVIEALGKKGAPGVLVELKGVTTDNFGDTALLDNKPLQINPLQCAVREGNYEAAHALVEYCSASPISRCSCGFMALHFAAMNGDYKLVKWFFKELKIPTEVIAAASMLSTPYALSLRGGHIDVAALLKDDEARKYIEIDKYDFNTEKIPNWLPAISDKKIGQLKQSIADGSVRVNQRNHPLQPLHIAASAGAYECAKLLIEKGANPFIRAGSSHDGETALELAVFQEHPEIIRLLIQSDCQPKDVENPDIPLIVLAVDKERPSGSGVEKYMFGRWVKLVGNVRSTVSKITAIKNEKYKSVDSEQTRETVRALLSGGSSLEQKRENNWTPLHLVVMRGDAMFAKFLLSLGAKTETRDRLDRTALYLAARSGHTEVMEQLVLYHADLEAQNHLGNTPLHRAAAKGKAKTLEWLLEHGANPNACNNRHKTPLMMLSSPDIVEKGLLLLKHHALLDLKDQRGQSGLNYLFQKFSAREVETVLRCFSYMVMGRSLTLKDRWDQLPEVDESGQTSLHRFARKGETAVINALVGLAKNIDVKNNEGQTPLHLAAKFGKTEAVLALYKGGANIEAYDDDGYTPLFFAAGSGHTETVEALLKSGAKVEFPRHIVCDTPLHLAARNGHTEAVLKLLEAGAKLEVRNLLRETPLWQAVSENQTETALALFQKGADVSALDAELFAKFDQWRGESGEIRPVRQVKTTGKGTDQANLFAAARDGRTEMVKELLSARADVDQASDDGAVPLLMAAKNGHTEVVRLLLEAGADATNADRDGVTPLAGAVQNGRIEVVRVLLGVEGDADLAHNSEGIKPLFLMAVQKGKTEVVKRLLRGGVFATLSESESALLFQEAVERGQAEVVKLLLGAGADANRVDSVDSTTPLFIAARRGHTDIVRVLMAGKGALRSLEQK